MTETTNNTVTVKVKRGWVKNAAIVFLAVLLVLTFFSNTIMNYSLPVVSAQYPLSGTISAKIRGTGTVSSNESFNVSVDETREIKTVAIKKGDTVEAGQVLFILEDVESDELKTAQQTLTKAEYDYQVFLLGLSAYSPEVNSAQNALSDAITAQNKAMTDSSDAKSELSKAKADLAAAQIAYDAAKTVLDAAQATYDLAETANSNAELAFSQAEAALTEAEGDLTEEEEALRKPLTDAEKDLEAATLAATNAKTNLDYYEGLYGSYATAVAAMEAQEVIMDDLDDQISEVNDQINSLNKVISRSIYSSLSEAKADAAIINREMTAMALEDDFVKEDYKNLQVQLDAANEVVAAYASIAELESQISTLEAKYRSAEITYDDAYAITRNSNIRSAMTDYEDALEWVTDATNTVYTETTKYMRLSPTKSTVVEKAKKDVTDKQNELTKAANALKAANTALTTAQRKFSTPESDLSKAEAAVDAAEAAIKDDNSSFAQAVRDAQQALEYAIETATTSDAVAELDVEQKKKAITDAEEEVARLTEESAPKEITAKYAGTITEMNYSAGDKTEYGKTMAVIEVTDKGYTLEISATSEQAAKVTIGDKAEITNVWSDITATLAQVVNDPDSAGQKKILRFKVEGSNVVAGQSLSLSIGQRSQNYDAIIPNSAIREDSNGKYIYTVETKSSALSNRYIAKRTDVNVLATDDTNSAVSGLLGGEFVIVSSTAPLEAGMQVRMSEG